MRHAEDRPLLVTEKTANKVANKSSTPDPGKEAHEATSLTSEELAQFRNEKLEAIRLAIAKGAYDSEELLEKALDRMLQQLEQTDQA